MGYAGQLCADFMVDAMFERGLAVGMTGQDEDAEGHDDREQRGDSHAGPGSGALQEPCGSCAGLPPLTGLFPTPRSCSASHSTSSRLSIASARWEVK